MENQDQAATPSIRKNLAAALAKVQGAIQNPKKDTKNPFFNSKYADLAGVWDSVRGHLAANGLAFIQMPTTEGNKVSVTGVLLHSSGEEISSTITGSAKDGTPQAIGSCITYLRRYQMSAILGIAAEDDDGAAASGTEKVKTAAQERPTFDKAITMEQHEAELAAKQKPPEPKAGTVARSQTDMGSFEDRIKFVRLQQEGKTGAGKPWKLYKIETEGHGEFSTFDIAVFNAAQTAVTLGHIVMVDTEPTPKGPKITGVRELIAEAA